MKQSFYELTLDTIRNFYEDMKKFRPYTIGFNYNYKGGFINVILYKKVDNVTRHYKTTLVCPTEAKRELIVEIVTKLHKSIGVKNE